ncbi:MAG TPA: tRNA uridine-5-carboxymethylaminomethyl(34) synthesis GTPase MnmE [Candidatus Fournierella excrementigallinarum]|nr:tRNA uridine-5-carboxymethylaminomethyl(34) synthesis GTPase MnmE [Candidatus Fournierella excrementigallinarum]
MADTIVALVTPPGEGGIAVVRLSGEEALAVAAKVFFPHNAARKVENAKGYTALYGNFMADGRQLDDGVALFFRAPHSYTGEDVAELSCHGGPVVAQGLIDACIAAGARPAGPGEYTRRAFVNGRIGLTQAEAVMSLIGAAGRQGAALARTALDGALAKRIEGFKQQLVALAGHIAAWVDFPEEDVPALEPEALSAALSEVRAGLTGLIENFGAGAVLREGVDAAIVGSPNVGKSTLLNLLAGFDRAIVTPIAGTTRDVVEQAVMLGGVRVTLRDTAGLRRTGDVVEAEGIRRSRRAMEEAGLVLAVFDGSATLSEEDEQLAAACAGRPAIAIVNKSDLPQKLDPAALAPRFSEVVTLAAGRGEGAQALGEAVRRVLGVAKLDPSAPCLVSRRQYAAACEGRAALEEAERALAGGFGLDAVSVCVDDALSALCRLTGEDASEAVVEEVFSTFCVGK